MTKTIGNIWRYSVGGKGNNHPASFPDKLAEDHILSWSNEGDTILDPMAGSGTTLKMAKLNNRNYIGVEISPEYVEIIRERLKQITNPKSNMKSLNNKPMTTKEKKIKEKYLKIKAEDLAGNYEVNINTDGTVSYKEEFIELDGRKYWCRKFGEDKWTYIRIKDFPFADFPKDFKKIRSFGDTLYDMNKINCKLLENSTLVKPNNEWERNWKGVIQNLYDSGFIDGQNNHKVISLPNIKVAVVIQMIENLLHQQKKDLIEEIETAVQWAIDNSKGDSYHNGLEEAKHILHLLKEKV